MVDVITNRSAVSAAPPKSVSSTWTVLATLVGSAVGCAIVFWWQPDSDSRYAALLLMACVFIPGALVEMFVNLSPESAGIDFRWRSLSVARIVRKLAALWTIFALLTTAYSALPLYAGKTYENFQFFWTTSAGSSSWSRSLTSRSSTPSRQNPRMHWLHGETTCSPFPSNRMHGT